MAWKLSLKHDKVDDDTLKEAIESAFEDSSGANTFGYRQLARTMKNKGLNCTRDQVAMLSKLIAPEAVADRLRTRLTRRTYTCPGPHHSLHSDQNDKLLKWGFGLHLGVDGIGVLFLSS